MHTMRQFEIVRALALHRHFGRAAAALGVSQPSLTRSLNRIEEEVGGSLFDRDGVTPTVFGAIVLKHGATMLGAAAELARELSLTKGLDLGELSVAMGLYAADISGYAAAGLLSRNHPNLSIDLRVTDWPRAKEAVLTGAADLAFADIRVAVAGTDFDVYPVRAGPLFFFCAADHPLAATANVAYADITLYPWAGPSLPPGLAAALPEGQRCCVTDKTTGLVRPRILVESFEAAKRIVIDGIALSAGLASQIAPEVAAGRLVLLPVATPIEIAYGFILKRNRIASPAVKAFMKIVRRLEAGVSQGAAEKVEPLQM